MQTLLNDIELDIQELKCLIQAISTDTNPILRIIAKRNIHQMQERLEMLVKQLDAAFVITSHAAVTPAAEASVVETSVAATPVVVTSVVEVAPEQILAERIKPATDLRHAISLNDSFRFTRELFNGDAARMNEIVRQLGEATSLDKALDLFTSTVHPDEENVAATDFVELLKKYFN